MYIPTRSKISGDLVDKEEEAQDKIIPKYDKTNAEKKRGKMCFFVVSFFEYYVENCEKEVQIAFYFIKSAGRERQVWSQRMSRLYVQFRLI